MKALFIGGTGTISTAVVRRLAADPLWEVWILNRGSRPDAIPDNVRRLTADIRDEAAVKKALGESRFDAVCQFIGFRREDVERDFRLFAGRTEQYIFTSSASAYRKPAAGYIVNEGTALANPYWEYARNKIACEEFLFEKYRESGFPVTVVRPSHTYDERHIPTGLHGRKGFWQVLRRMLDGKPVLIHGDGSSLWTVTFHTDFARGYTGLVGAPAAIGEAFQITGDETLTWNQIYETIAAALGVTLRPYYVSSAYLAAAGERQGYDFRGGLLGDKAVSVVFDNTKLKRLVSEIRTGTEVPFRRGVRLALAYILSHPEECQIPDPEFDAWCDKVIDVQENSLSQIPLC